MDAKLPKIVFDLYDWLPNYGETEVKYSLQGSSLVATVIFDSEDKEELVEKKIVFRNTCSFSFSSFPGIQGGDGFSCDCKLGPTGALVEFKESKPADLWTEHFQLRKVRHFQVFFLAANQRLDVFSESVALND